MLNDAQTSEFVQLLTASQSDLYIYIRAFVFKSVDASDILGETNLTVWENRDKFQLGSNFQAWARCIAHHKVLEWHAKRRRDRVVLSEEMIDELAERQEEAPGQHLTDLRHCLGKLPPDERELIMRRYNPGVSAEQIAAEVQRPTEWVYKAVGRIRRMLSLCVARQMALRHREECR